MKGCQETRRWLNNRAENSHQPFRRREGAMAPVQRHQDLAEIRLHSRLDLQPFQPPTPSQPPRYFQTSPSHRLGRMASTCTLRVLYYGFFCSGPVSLTMPLSGTMILVAGRTTEPRILTYQSDRGNDECSVSNRLDQRSGFSLPTPPSTTPSTSNAI